MTDFNLNEYIMRHLMDSHQWHLPFLPPLELPSFLTLHGLMVLICSLLLIVLFCGFYQTGQRVPHGLTNLLETFVVFVRDEIAIECLGKEDGRKMAPLLCTFFFFILGLNLLGMIPLFPAATANANVTGGLALVTLCFIIFGAIHQNGIKGFLKAIIPSGVPFPILLILVPIEILGLFIKAFALMIRLFANMLAGHVVILAILGMVVTVGYVAALPSVILALFISLLELFVAFLQAYIFTLLSAIFIGLTYQPEH